MLWQAAAPRELQIDSVYLPLHLFAQRDTVKSLAAHRWLAGGFSKRLLSTLAEQRKNPCCTWEHEAAVKRGLKTKGGTLLID